MMPLEKMSDEDFERHALAILQSELGLDGIARFRRLYRAGTGTRRMARHAKTDIRQHYTLADFRSSGECWPCRTTESNTYGGWPKENSSGATV